MTGHETFGPDNDLLTGLLTFRGLYAIVPLLSFRVEILKVVNNRGGCSTKLRGFFYDS